MNKRMKRPMSITPKDNPMARATLNVDVPGVDELPDGGERGSTEKAQEYDSNDIKNISKFNNVEKVVHTL